MTEHERQAAEKIHGPRASARPPTAPLHYRYLGNAEELPEPRLRASLVVPLYGMAAWVAQRRRAPDMGKLEFPSGTCEVGELHRAGAQRELREETGIAAEPQRLRLLQIVAFPAGGPYPSCEMAIYTLHLRGDEAPKDTEPTVRARWELVTLRALAGELAKGRLRGGAGAAVGALFARGYLP